MLKQEKAAKGLQGSIGRVLAAIPLKPNHWTMLSILVALAAGLAIAVYNELIVGLLLFAVAGALDMVDGAVARARDETSALGGFLDGLSDRFVEAVFLFSMMFYTLPTILIDAKIWLAGVIFLGTCMPSYVRAYADHKGVVSRERALALSGICERSERIVLIIIGLAAGLLLSLDFFIYALILICLLSLITIFQRISDATRL
jgi:phosphatidylglycerophosphate synthase